MGGCRCSYKTCKSATKTTENLHFFHYPVKHRERCAVWIRNAEKPEYTTLPDDQLRNKVICGLHFERKYFTNIQKKRLVHDAIPTLDAGCENDEGDPNKGVEVLLTSNDGTTFTLQTDHIQPGTSSNGEQKYSFRNGKLVIHNFENTESEVYTIDPSYIQQPFYADSKDVFINKSNLNDSTEGEVVYNTSSNSSFKEDEGEEEQESQQEDVEMAYEKNSNENARESEIFKEQIPVEEYIEEQEESNRIHNLFFDDEEQQKSNEGNNENAVYEEADTDESLNNEKNKKQINANVLRKIKMHSQEIANIKRSLLAQSSSKLTSKRLIRMLKGRVPDSLLGALLLSLYKRQTNFTREEKAFLRIMNKLPTSACNHFREYGWKIPKQISD